MPSGREPIEGEARPEWDAFLVLSPVNPDGGCWRVPTEYERQVTDALRRWYEAEENTFLCLATLSGETFYIAASRLESATVRTRETDERGQEMMRYWSTWGEGDEEEAWAR